MTRTGFIAGTPHYMSPEQARGEAVRASSDLFGLGSVLYFMLTGRPPFRAERTLAILSRICNEPHRPVREVNPDVPPAIADLVDRLLNKSAADRIADAETVRTHCLHLLAALTEPDGDLNSIELGDSPFAVVQPRDESHGQRRNSHDWSWALVVLLLIGLNVAAGAIFLRGRQPFVDSPEMAQEDAIAAEASPSSDFPEPMAFSASKSKTEESAAYVRADSPPFPIMAGTDDVEASPLFRPTPRVPGKLQATIRAAREEPAATFDPCFASPPSLAKRASPLPAWQELPQSTPRDVVVATEELSVWTTRLNEIRASFDLFETQIEQPSGSAMTGSNSISPSAPNLFDQELLRIEDALRMLDSGSDRDDLPPDGKRAAVLAITAARHEGLLKKLKDAEGEEEEKEAAEALKTNYTEHYAIETWWREQRLVELEERLEELRAQVKQRQDSQEKYITAVMTIAELWADGIAIAPPKPGNAPEYSDSVAPVLPGPVPATPTYAPPAYVPSAFSGSWTPPVSAMQPKPANSQPAGARGTR